MNPLVVAFSGPIGSGKTTLSLRVSEALGWPRVSFGDHVRSVARSRGLRGSRVVLQEVGLALIEEGWAPFCEAVLEQADWQPGQALLVDGVRHIEALETLRQLVAPLTVALVHVAVDESIQQSRLREQASSESERVAEMWAHPIEIQVGSVLPLMADLVIDGSGAERELVEQVVTWIRRR